MKESAICGKTAHKLNKKALTRAVTSDDEAGRSLAVGYAVQVISKGCDLIHSADSYIRSARAGNDSRGDGGKQST